jgi:hypothetical protein
LTPDAPRFVEGKPWHVDNFRVDGHTLNIDIQDSTDVAHTLKLPYEQVQVIEHVDQNEDSSEKRLYAHIRRTPSDWYFQAAPVIVYLGEVKLTEWRRLRECLKEIGIDFVWEQKPRRENVKSLIPSSWEPDLSY